MTVAVITGSAGLIGSQAALHFGGSGFDVLGVDNDMRRVFFGASKVAADVMVQELRPLLRDEDFTWLSVHSVSAGSMLALSVPVLFGLWIAAGRQALPWPRWVYGSLFAMHLLFLLLTRTQGSIGGALAANAVIA